MVILKNTKKNTRFILVLILCCLTAIFQSCKKKRSEMAGILFKKTHNIVFKEMDPDEFTVFFKKELLRERSKMSNPQLLADHYKMNDYEPDFVLYHLWDGGIEAMLEKYRKASEHGLDPKLFQPDEIYALMTKIYSKDAIKTPEEAYKVISKLEIMTANSLVNYSSALQYGIINPRKIYSRYFIKTQRPDSTSINRVFYVENMTAYLDSIQPKNPDYLALQKAYLEGYEAPKMSKEETRRILLVNMERLR